MDSFKYFLLCRMELHHQLLLAQTKKKELRKELRAFENEFLAKHKRYTHTHTTPHVEQ